MSNPSSLSPRERNSAALCAALGTAGTVLVLECFRIPNSYMSLSLASTLSLLPRPSLGHLFARIIALTLGIMISMIVLTAFPQAPWFSFPLAALISAVGYAFFFKHSGPGSAYSFGAYFLAFYVTAGYSFQGTDFVIEALKLWAQSIIPITITYFAAVLTKDKIATPGYAKIDLSSIVSIGLTIAIAIMFDTAIKTDQAARLVMASISTICTLELEQSVGLYLQRMVGYFLGAAIATVFLVSVVALANEITLYLLAIGCIFGLLEWLACCFPNYTTLFRGITAMVSFSVLMIPAPDENFHVAYGRITTSLIGFFTAIVIYLLIRECVKVTKQLMVPRSFSRIYLSRMNFRNFIRRSFWIWEILGSRLRGNDVSERAATDVPVAMTTMLAPKRTSRTSSPRWGEIECRRQPQRGEPCGSKRVAS